MSPVPPPVVTFPYDTLESVLNTARVRLNDAIQNISGDILTDTQPFTGQMVNDAWRKLQAYLANLGHSRFKQQFIALALPVVGSTDPSAQTFWSWTQFFDGAGFFSPPVVTVLPPDFILPLRLYERPTGSNTPFRPMGMAVDGLPDCQKIPWNRWFEWREDAIYMPGSTYSMDIRVEYAAFLADFTTTNNVLDTPASQQVPILRSRSALANYICAEMTGARGDVDAGSFVSQAEADAQLIFNNEVKLKQRTPVQRRSYSGRGGSSWRLYGNSGY